MLAVQTGNIDIVQELLSNGADINTTDNLGRTALTIASAFGQKEVAQILKLAGASAGEIITQNIMDEKLIIAAAKGLEDEIEELLYNKADPNSKTSDGWTPLMWAVHESTLHSVWMLAEAGANVNAKTVYGVTPLMIAASGIDKETIGFLIIAGAEISLKDIQGKTALDYAMAASNEYIIQILQGASEEKQVMRTEREPCVTGDGD